MVKAVLDTNVFIAGLLTDGVCRSIFRSFIRKEFLLVVSPAIFEELCKVLRRPKFKNLINKDDILDLIIFLELNAILIQPKLNVSKCRDPEDNHLLATTITSGADFLVTGYKDLLVLNPFLNIPIVTPSKFIKLLNKSI